MFKTKTLAAVASLAMAGSAMADVVNLTGFTFPPAAVVLVGAPAYQGEAGQFSGTWDSNSFVAFCVELTQNVSFNSDQNYTLVTGAARFGAQKSSDLSRLYTAAPSFVTDASTSAAFQAAVWEVVYEAGTSYDLSGGAFKGAAKYAGDVSTVAAFSSINNVLLNLGSYAPNYMVSALVNREFQDLIVVEVPEPETYALMLAGLGAVGFMAKRRKSA